MTNQLACSYIYRGEDCFFVSTINRESSALLAPESIYAETMAWRFDPISKTRGELLGQGEAPSDSISMHNLICERLFKAGHLDEVKP